MFYYFYKLLGIDPKGNVLLLCMIDPELAGPPPFNDGHQAGLGNVAHYSREAVTRRCSLKNHCRRLSPSFKLSTHLEQDLNLTRN